MTRLLIALAGLAIALAPAMPASALDASKSGVMYKRLVAAPNFALPTPDGETVSLDDYKGKVRLVVFFATWCPSCRAEAPDLEALQRKYGAKGLKVLALSKEEPQTLKDFAEKAGLSYTMLIRDKSLSALYGGVTSIPTTFVVGRKGHIYKHFVGKFPRQALEKAVTDLL